VLQLGDQEHGTAGLPIWTHFNGTFAGSRSVYAQQTSAVAGSAASSSTAIAIAPRAGKRRYRTPADDSGRDTLTS